MRADVNDLVSTKAALLQRTVIELKDMLKVKGLSMQGKKEILIERLAQALIRDEGVNGRGDVGEQSAAKKQCRRKDELAVELEHDAASPGSGFEEAIPAKDVANALEEAMPADEDDDTADKEEHSGDSDDEEEEYDSIYD